MKRRSFTNLKELAYKNYIRTKFHSANMSKGL